MTEAECRRFVRKPWSGSASNWRCWRSSRAPRASGRAGSLAGIGYGLVVLALLRRCRLGPADRVTLARATLIGCVTALVAESMLRPEPVALLVPLAAVALVLDAVDGWVARRTGTVSELGARFDMEADAFLILVLSGYVAGSSAAGCSPSA